MLAALLLVAGRPAVAVCGNPSLPGLPQTGNKDGTVRVCESTLNEFAAAVLPQSRSASFSFTVWVPNPFTYWPFIPITINGTATATVTSIVFRIRPAFVDVEANVSGQVLGFPFQGRLSTTVAVTLNQASRSLSFRPGTMNLRPRVEPFPGIFVDSPFTISLAPSLDVPAIPLGAAPFEIATPEGPRAFVLASRDLELSRGNGFLEIKGNVRFR